MQAGDTMYNRYIPQQDGSHKRNRVETPPRPVQQAPHKPVPPPEPPHVPPTQPHPPQPANIGSFLRHLLPKDIDTDDLIVVLLLLLMAGDKPEDKSSALLTLALYCFL